MQITTEFVNNDKKFIRLVFTIAFSILALMFLINYNIKKQYEHYENATIVRLINTEVLKTKDNKLIVNENLNDDHLLHLKEHDARYGFLDKTINYQFDDETVQKDYYEIYNIKKALKINNKHVENPNLAERTYLAIKYDDKEMIDEINNEIKDININKLNTKQFKKDNLKLSINCIIIVLMFALIIFMLVFIV